eukprot:g5604.t1
MELEFTLVAGEKFGLDGAEHGGGAVEAAEGAVGGAEQRGGMSRAGPAESRWGLCVWRSEMDAEGAGEDALWGERVVDEGVEVCEEVGGAERCGGAGAALEFVVDAVDGECGGDAVTGDINEDDEDGPVGGWGWEGEGPDKEEVAADLAHGLVAVGDADGAAGDGRGEEGLVDPAGVGEVARDFGVAVEDGSGVESVGEAAVAPPSEGEPGGAGEGGSERERCALGERARGDEQEPGDECGDDGQEGEEPLPGGEGDEEAGEEVKDEDGEEGGEPLSEVGLGGVVERGAGEPGGVHHERGDGNGDEPRDGDDPLEAPDDLGAGAAVADEVDECGGVDEEEEGVGEHVGAGDVGRALERAGEEQAPGRSGGGCVHHEDPLHDAAGGDGVHAQVAEHVDGLGAVVHGVGGDVGEDGAAGEGVGLASALAGERFVEWFVLDGGEDVAGDLVEGFEQLDGGHGAVGFEAVTLGALGEEVAPAAHGGEDVGHGGADGLEAHVELAVELVVGERSAGVEEVAGGPVVVGEEDLDGVAGGHGWFSPVTPRIVPETLGCSAVRVVGCGRVSPLKKETGMTNMKCAALCVSAMALLVAPAWAQLIDTYSVAGDGSRPTARPGAMQREIVTFAGGVLSGVEASAPWGVRTIATLAETEGVLRGHGGQLYVLTPESGVVRVFDRAGTLVGQVSVDPGLEPVDVAPIGNGEMFVSTAADGRVVRLSLGGGLTRSVVDLAELDEPDGKPDPGMMIVDGGRLFVQLRRLDDKTPWMFNERGALAVIDIETGALIDADEQRPGVQAIELGGPHPRLKMRVLDGPRRLYISSSGADPYTVWPPGGMDEVDLESLTSLGLVFSEMDAANISAIWPLTTTSGILIFHTDIIASAHLAAYSVAPYTSEQIHNELFGYVEVLEYDGETERLFMPTLDGQVRVFDAVRRSTLAIPEIGGGVATDIELVRW